MEISISKDWVEILAISLIALGFIAAVTTKSAAVIYVISILAGIMFGRILFETRKGPKIPMALICAGFIVGYLIGTIYASRLAVVALFVIGLISGYILHEK